MALQKFANNASGTLNGAISSGATSFVLQSGEGALFPSLAAGEYCYVRLGSDSSNEVVKVTAISTDTFTCVATANAWADATPVILPASQEMLDEFIQLAGVQTITGVKTFNDSTLLLAGSTSGAATVKAPAVAGSAVVTLPGATGTLATLAGAETFSNKRTTKRYGSVASSATPTINTDNYDIYGLTAQAAAITSFTTNLSGTPSHGDMLLLEISSAGAYSITWGSGFEDGAITLPVTTVAGKMLSVLCVYNSNTSKWRGMAAGPTS